MHYRCQNFLILSHFSDCFEVSAGCKRLDYSGGSIFERRGANSRGGANLLFDKFFAEYRMDMKEIQAGERTWRRSYLPLD